MARTLCHYTYVTVPSASVEAETKDPSPDGTYKPNALKALIVRPNLERANLIPGSFYSIVRLFQRVYVVLPIVFRSVIFVLPVNLLDRV